MSLCKECVSGVTHEGTPLGQIELVNGVSTYIAFPKGDFPKEKAILLLTDIFGVQLNNNKADDFARNGFQVYMPDMFGGEAVPENAMANPGSVSVLWSEKNSTESTRIVVDSLITGLRHRGITTYGAVGYCYGARHVIDLARENTISVAAVAHPSRLVVPGDFHDLVQKSRAPLLINSCETDSAFPQESCQKADEILGEGKYQPGYARQHWLGCTHGFAVRGDMSNPQVKAGKEGAFKATVEWFLKL
ncbi:alpha/beta-hydrolase [Gautieria morchelliformis]|nr:alpha/beta-hydrolase [Gautieria morchelliformis]